MQGRRQRVPPFVRSTNAVTRLFQHTRPLQACMTRSSAESNWLPLSSDVVACTAWKPSGETTLRAFGASLNLAIGQSCSGDPGPSQLHIPELSCYSHAFANVGGRICCMTARHQEGTEEIDLAISTASHGASQVPGAVAAGDGEVQFWSIGQAGQLTCQSVLAHPGGRADALQWCPSMHAFSGALDGRNRQDPGLGLLLIVANRSALIYAVPKHPADLAAASCPDRQAVYRMTLAPKVEIPAARMAGEAATCAKWSPHAPNDEVLVGTQWGGVALIKLHGAGGEQAPSFTVSSLVRAGSSSIRCLVWAPVETQPGADPGDNATLYCVCAGQAQVAIYDSRQPQAPLLDLSIGSQGPDATDAVWLEGDGCPLLVVAFVDGSLRRFCLAQAPACLGCTVASTVDGVTAVAYSDSLKLVGYATGGGEAGVLACIARINPLYIESNGWSGAQRCVPRAPLFKASFRVGSGAAEGGGSWSVAAGKALPAVAPSEYWRGRLDVDMGAKESVEAIREAAHPWASVPHLLLVDGASDNATTCICCTNSCMFMICEVSLSEAAAVGGGSATAAQEEGTFGQPPAAESGWDFPSKMPHHNEYSEAGNFWLAEFSVAVDSFAAAWPAKYSIDALNYTGLDAVTPLVATPPL